MNKYFQVPKSPITVEIIHQNHGDNSITHYIAISYRQCNNPSQKNEAVRQINVQSEFSHISALATSFRKKRILPVRVDLGTAVN